jgi:hypothetical protein
MLRGYIHRLEGKGRTRPRQVPQGIVNRLTQLFQPMIIDTSLPEFSDIPETLQGEILLERTIDSQGRVQGWQTVTVENFARMFEGSISQVMSGIPQGKKLSEILLELDSPTEVVDLDDQENEASRLMNKYNMSEYEIYKIFLKKEIIHGKADIPNKGTINEPLFDRGYRRHIENWIVQGKLE